VKNANILNSIKKESFEYSGGKEKLAAQVQSVDAAAEGKSGQGCSAAGVVPSARSPSTAIRLRTKQQETVLTPLHATHGATGRTSDDDDVKYRIAQACCGMTVSGGRRCSGGMVSQ